MVHPFDMPPWFPDISSPEPTLRQMLIRYYDTVFEPVESRKLAQKYIDHWMPFLNQPVVQTDEEIEVQFVRPATGCPELVYKLVPHPDAEAHDFKDGAALMWVEGKDTGGHFFVGPKDLRAIAEMFRRAADIAGV